MAKGGSVELIKADTNLRFEKFDRYPSRDLLQKNILSSRLDVTTLVQTAREVLHERLLSMALSAGPN